MYNPQPPRSQDTPRLALGPEMISLAWQRLSEQMGPWVLSSLVLYAINFGIGLVRAAFQVPLQRDNGGEFSPALLGLIVVFGLLQGFVQSVLMGGMYQMALNHLQGKAVAVGDLFKRLDVVGVLFVTTLLSGLATAFGLVLCLVPGLLLSALFMFAVPLVVDRGLSPSEALSTSLQALKQDMWPMLGLTLLLGLVQLGGALACGIGVLWTMPLHVLTIAIAYRQYFPVEETPESYAGTPPTILGGER